jgi:hypothetical protein
MTANSVVTLQTPAHGEVQILPADAQALKTVYTGAANGSKITSLILQSTDTAARDVQISISKSGTAYILGTVTCPINAGNTGAIPSVNAFNSTQLPGIPIDSEGNPFVFLLNAETLTISALTTVTAAKAISANAFGGDF